MQQQTGHHMNHESTAWNLVAVITGLFTAVTSWDFQQWVAVLGVVGMFFSIGIQWRYRHKEYSLKEREFHKKHNKNG